MVVFEDLQDVKEWLEPLDYIGFWDAVEPYNLILQDREFCDEQIADGRSKQSLVLNGLKILAKMELGQRFGLNPRIYHPPLMGMH